jgi:acetylornithine/N-succinyldiaminopimelate aminotransferase
LIEPIQGESGVRALAAHVLADMRSVCDRHGILLLVDEVQTGVGRTGHLFAYQGMGIEPDILASAKGLGNGFPVAACLATEAAASGMTPGTHGSTFGGNPLAMVVASEVLDIVLFPGFLERVRSQGELLAKGLEALTAGFPDIFKAVRGEGLLLGLKCKQPVRDVARAVREEGLLTVVAGEDVLRILPPLNISIDEIDEGLARLRSAAHSLAVIGRSALSRTEQ